MAQIDRLIQLIEENCKSKGFSQTKTAKIIALVNSTLEMGTPDAEELKDRLEDIGRSD